MSLLEKFNERKSAMYAKFDEAREACEAAIETAGEEFLDDFKAMVASATDEEFTTFLMEGVKELDEIEMMAALAARTEAKMGKTKVTDETEEKPKKKSEGPGIFIIGLG